MKILIPTSLSGLYIIFDGSEGGGSSGDRVGGELSAQAPAVQDQSFDGRPTGKPQV